MLTKLIVDGQVLVLKNAAVVSVEYDGAGSIWIATAGGLYREFPGTAKDAEGVADQIGGLVSYNLQKGGRVWLRPTAIDAAATTTVEAIQVFTAGGHSHTLTAEYDIQSLVSGGFGG